MIDILLATYNGERFLSEQLNSLINQTYKDFRILIRDDGSTDNTRNIIASYVEKYPDKIVVIEDDIKCGSPVSNFMQLCKYSTAEYFMFCDQDDVWNKDKAELSINEKKIRAKIWKYCSSFSFWKL